MANPPGLLSLAVEIKRLNPLSALAGIEGDNSHTFGYHKSPDWLRAYGDYGANDASLLGPLNAGFNNSYASAIDISFWAQHSLNVTVSRRMRAALKARDPRLFYRGQWVLAEVAGTLDGVQTWAYYTGSMTEQFGAWDKTHLDHNHYSVNRKFCNNYTALKGIAAVMAGVPAATDWFDMATEAQLDKVIGKYFTMNDPKGVPTKYTLAQILNTKLQWWGARTMSTLRKGSANQGFTAANSGTAVVDGQGIDGQLLQALQSIDARLAALEAK